MPVPPGTRGKQLDVVLRKDFIRVGLKGEPPVIEGTLAKEIKVDDSTWTLGALLPLECLFLASLAPCADPTTRLLPCLPSAQTTRAR